MLIVLCYGSIRPLLHSDACMGTRWRKKQCSVQAKAKVYVWLKPKANGFGGYAPNIWLVWYHLAGISPHSRIATIDNHAMR